MMPKTLNLSFSHRFSSGGSATNSRHSSTSYNHPPCAGLPERNTDLPMLNEPAYPPPPAGDSRSGGTSSSHEKCVSSLGEPKQKRADRHGALCRNQLFPLRNSTPPELVLCWRARSQASASGSKAWTF